MMTHRDEYSRLSGQLLIAVALVCFSCGSPDVDDGDRYHILDYDGDQDRYRLVEASVETLEDPRSVDGEVVYLRAGGRIVMDEANPETQEEFEQALRISGSTTPKASYEVSGGLVSAWDFDSLMMLTLYHHFEKAAFFFENIGVDRDVVGRLPVYYAPRLEVFIPINLLTDNAAYAFTMDAFLMPRQFFLSGIPFAANRGVIVHEYSHAVFNRLVHGDARAPEYLVAPWPDPAINRMRALDEGVADIFGGLATQDPNFISPSIAEDEFEIDRDLSVERQYTESLYNRVQSEDSALFNPYELGSVIASTVWALRPHVDEETLGAALVNTLSDFGDVDSSFELSDFFDLLHGHLPEEARPQACLIFHDRLTAISERLQCDP